MATTTVTSTQSWRPDLTANYSPSDLVGDALVLTLASYGGAVEGDAPAVRVPFVVDTDAAVVPEGDEITATDPELNELVFMTYKLAKLAVVSREQAHNVDAASQIANSLYRSIINLADELFLSGPVTTGRPTGITSLITETVTPTLGTDGYAAFDAIADLEAEGGRATHWVLHPTDWAVLAKIPSETGSNVPALGGLSDSATRSLAGVPVVVSRFATPGKALLIDSAEIVSAYGYVTISSSTDYAFNRDAVTIRGTWRLGWGVPRPTRAGRIVNVGVGA